MSKPDEEIARAALGWLVRVNDPAFDAWDAWEVWLASDPRHAEQYWQLAATEADAVDALASAPVTRHHTQTRNSSRGWLHRPMQWVAIAAGLLLIGGLWGVWMNRPQTWVETTTAGAPRSLTLADGTRLHLDGATRVTLDRRHPRSAVLDQGRVLVEVVHNETAPFVLTVDDAVLTDLGTVFDVTRLDKGLRVGVSEGVVRVDVDRRSVTLNAGDGLVLVNGTLTQRQVQASDVTDWQGGRLTYNNDKLSLVAEDLSRTLGKPVLVAPQIADRRFTGSLAATDEQIKTRIRQLLNVNVIDEGTRWRLEPRPDP